MYPGFCNFNRPISGGSGVSFRLPHQKRRGTKTYQGDFTLPSELLEQIAAQGFDVLPELTRIVINAAIQAERRQYLGAAPYQHSPDRRGHANGYKPKTVKTRLGEITLVSSFVVSRAAALLDATLEPWRNRPIGEFPYVFLDTRYEKVRQDGQIQDAAVLIASGVAPDGHRKLLGYQSR